MAATDPMIVMMIIAVKTYYVNYRYYSLPNHHGRLVLDVITSETHLQIFAVEKGSSTTNGVKLEAYFGLRWKNNLNKDKIFSYVALDFPSYCPGSSGLLSISMTLPSSSEF